VAEATATERELIGMLREVLDAPDDFDIEPAKGLRQAGIPSLSLIAFIVAIEQRYQFQWDDDVPPETMRSVSTLARYVDNLVGSPG
jgi:acyl carrier protein